MNGRRVAAVALALVLGGAVVGGGVAVTALIGRPAEPTRYTVVRGDTLSLIARAHGVTVAELKGWNQLEGDLIEIGQVLLIWPTAAGSAPSPGRSGPRPDRGGTPDRPRLELPPPKPCLAGPHLDGTADEAMAASEGLSHEQVSAAMNGFLPNVLPCLDGVDPAPAEALRLAIRVGCDGRVASIDVADAGDWSSEPARCVVDLLRYAPFPAHGLPDGDRFEFPLRYSPP